MNNVEKYLGNVRVLSLVERLDRQEETKAQLYRLGLRFFIIPATDMPHDPRRGCSLSHIRALEDFARDSSAGDYLLLLEDDCVFDPEFAAKFNALDLSAAAWDCLKLGSLHMEKPAPVGGICRAVRHLDSHAMLYNRRDVWRHIHLRLYGYEVGAISDLLLLEQGHNMRTYACYPNLVWQSVNLSDIVGSMYSNYDDQGRQTYQAHLLN